MLATAARSGLRWAPAARKPRSGQIFKSHVLRRTASCRAAEVVAGAALRRGDGDVARAGLPAGSLHAAARRCGWVPRVQRVQSLSTSHGKGSERTPEEDAAAAANDTPAADIDYVNVEEALASKSTFEVARAVLVFELAAVPFFVHNADKILGLAKAPLVGPLLSPMIAWWTKATFFGHFCAGGDQDEIQPTINNLESHGVRAILDYAAEADVEDDSGDSSKAALDALEAAERLCDLNADITLSAINTAARQTYGFAAVKLTALGPPDLLLHMSNILHEIRRLFRKFAQESSVRTGTANMYTDTAITFEDFEKAVDKLKLDVGEKGTRAAFDRFDRNDTGYIDYIEWIDSLDPLLIGRQAAADWVNSHNHLSESELSQLDRMFSRLGKLVEAADRNGVTLMVDAEYTYIQPAIDHVVLHLQRKYNRGRFPIVYNTYQCYLRDALSRVQLDLKRSAREGFWFGGKVVRGAYMVSERERAKRLKYADPIHPNIEATHECYNAAVDLIMEHIDHSEVMVASHNEHSIRYVTRRMEELGIKRRDGGVFFGQLLGMCDYLTFTLGANGFSVYKYVPYGPWDQVMPYLLRRAQENSAMLGGDNARKERKLWRRELRRRLLGR